MNAKFKFSFLLPVLLTVLLFTFCKPQNQAAFSDSHKTALSSKFTPGKLNPAAPPETEQLGQLAGIWEAEQVKRNRDGSWSEEKSKAEWRWYYILDGHAIQDDWISIEATNDSAKIYRPVGTNIRIYNAEEKQWHMAWIDKTNRRLASFSAVYEDGKIIMSGQNAKGRQIRNTFFNITRDSFDWKQEWTFDKGQSWVEVAKIRCTRKR
jgi:hypothetical protein